MGKKSKKHKKHHSLPFSFDSQGKLSVFCVSPLHYACQVMFEPPLALALALATQA